MLTIQCPDCDYTDQGYDTDLIITAYRKHETECTANDRDFLCNKTLGENTMSATFKDFLERKYAEGIDPSKAGRLLRQEVERTSDLPGNPYREANDD